MAIHEPFEVIPVPLAEAKIEVRFPGEMDAVRRLGEIQRAVRVRS